MGGSLTDSNMPHHHIPASLHRQIHLPVRKRIAGRPGFARAQGSDRGQSNPGVQILHRLPEWREDTVVPASSCLDLPGLEQDMPLNDARRDTDAFQCRLHTAVAGNRRRVIGPLPNDQTRTCLGDQAEQHIKRRTTPKDQSGSDFLQGPGKLLQSQPKAEFRGRTQRLDHLIVDEHRQDRPSGCHGIR